MSQPNPDPLKQAQDYIRSGDLPRAQRLLVDFVKQNPNSEQGWFLLSQAVADPKRKVDCLQRVLRLNPANAEAQRQLVKAMAAPAAPVTPPATEASPPASAVTPGELAFASAPPQTYTPPAPAPEVKPADIPVEPVPAPEPAVEEAAQQDAGLNKLRSQLQSSAEKSARGQRRRKPLRIVMLLLLILLAILLGVYFFVLRPQQNNSAAAPVAVADTPTPTITPTPTETPTPSITPTRFPATWTPTSPPTAIPTRTPTPLPPLSGDVEAALSQVQDQVVRVRGLKLDDKVPRALVSREALEPAIKSVLNLPDVLSALPDEARALSALGLIKPTYDLTRYFFNTFADNVGGFYVPWQKVLYVAGDKLGPEQRLIFSHEIDHALLDQNFHTDKMGVYPQCTLDRQRCQAIRALIEGDATLTMQQWLAQSASKQDKQDLADYQLPAAAVPEQFAPSFITQDVSFPYTMGLEFVKGLYERGGWSQVNQAYDKLPLSTEQILHPQKYAAGEQPVPVAAIPLTDTLGKGWQLVFDDVLGEWTTYLVLSSGVDEASRLSADVARKAAEGWGGDRVQVYYQPEADQTVMTAEWRWDTPADVTEFKGALTTYLDQRFRGTKLDVPGQECWILNHRVACLFVTDQGVLWLSTPDVATLDKVRTAYRLP